MKRVVILNAIASVYCGMVQAQDFFDTIEVGTENVEELSALSTQSYILQKAKYGLATPNDSYAFEREQPGFTQWQTDLFLQWRFKSDDIWLFQLSAKAEIDWWQWQRGRGKWRKNKERVLLKDAFVDGNFSSGTWMRFGNQVFAWGESEGLIVSDVLAPRDMREFGQADLRDLREPVPALMLSQNFSDARLSLVTTYAAGHNRYADISEEYYPYIALKNTGIPIQFEEPRNKSEWALRYERYFNGGDVSMVVADINNNDYTMRFDQRGLHLFQDRISVLAVFFNRALGNFLWRGEVGHYWNQPVFNAEGIPVEQDQLRLVAGFDYSGWNDWSLGYELNALVGRGERGGTESDRGHVLRLSHSVLNERLRQQLWLQSLLQDNGAVLRYDLSYDYDDHREFGFGLVLYEGANEGSQLYPYSRHDTFNLSVKYSF